MVTRVWEQVDGQELSDLEALILIDQFRRLDKCPQVMEIAEVPRLLD